MVCSGNYKSPISGKKGNGKKRNWWDGVGHQQEGHWVPRLGLGFCSGEGRSCLRNFKQSSDMIIFCCCCCCFSFKLILIVDRVDRREQGWRQRPLGGLLLNQRRDSGLNKRGTGKAGEGWMALTGHRGLVACGMRVVVREIDLRWPPLL